MSTYLLNLIEVCQCRRRSHGDGKEKKMVSRRALRKDEGFAVREYGGSGTLPYLRNIKSCWLMRRAHASFHQFNFFSQLFSFLCYFRLFCYSFLFFSLVKLNFVYVTLADSSIALRRRDQCSLAQLASEFLKNQMNKNFIDRNRENQHQQEGTATKTHFF